MLNQSKKRWRILDLIATTKTIFEKQNIDDPRLNAELLLADTLGVERIDLYAKYNRPLSKEEIARFRKQVTRRLNREPLQYILGQTEFMSLNFHVNPSVLIPRQDTEHLVEWIIEDHKFTKKLQILDIGTGSGNIAVSLAHYLPQATVYAVDCSLDALQIARKNTKMNRVENNVFFLKADMAQYNLNGMFRFKFDVIASNPPYVTKEEFKQLAPEVGEFEPLEALIDPGSNGYYYQKLAAQSIHLLKSSAAVYVEFGAGHSPKITQIFQNNGFLKLDIRKDFGGIERILRAQNN